MRSIIIRIQLVTCIIGSLELLSFHSFGQVNLYPASFGLMGEAKSVFNPALLNMDEKYVIQLGNQFFPGTYSQLENHFLLAAINLSSDTAKSKNNLGVKLISEKEGEFIRRPKAYLSYGYHTRLFRDYFLSAGVNLGFAGYVYKPTTQSAEGSDFTPDGDLGLAFYNRKWTGGVALNQALSSTLTPKIQEFRYKRFATFYLEKKWFFKDNNILSAAYQFQGPGTYHQSHTFALNYTFQNLLTVGGNLLWQERLNFTLGLHEIHYEEHRLRIMLGYNVPLQVAAQSNIQSFELIIAYFRKSAKN